MTSSALQKYLDQLQGLQEVSHESARRIVDDDSLFVCHTNLFVKSYLVTLCSILESYLKEEILAFVEDVAQVVDDLSLTRNIVVWGLDPCNNELYEKQVGNNITTLKLNIAEDDVDERISGNVDRTIKTFRRCGIDITQCSEFANVKATVATIVLKRNSVVHHSIQSIDFTYNDIVEWASKVKTYIMGISTYVNSERQKNTNRLQAIMVAQGNTGGM